MKFFPFLVLAYVVGEIAALIFVGQRLGILLTLFLLFASFVAGFALIRSTGLAVSKVMGRHAASPQDAKDMASTATFRFTAGLLLVVPGFLTDVAALLLLLPPVQAVLGRRLAGQFKTFRAEWTTPASRQGPVIDGEAVEIEGEITSRPRRPE